jgi:hypothetical protein
LLVFCGFGAETPTTRPPRQKRQNVKPPLE